MRQITFEIPGDPPLTIHAIEQEDGTILFNLSITGDKLADLRGLYFNLTDDSPLYNLSVTGADLTDQAYSDVSNLKEGNNVNGGGKSSYDVGLGFGTPGSGHDDINSTSFVLSSINGDPLSLDLIAHMEFTARLNSIGDQGSQRNGSEKISVIAPAAPDAIDDTADTLEDTPVTVDVVANDTDADGDSLTVIEVGAANNGTVEIVDNQILYTPEENWSGTDSFTYTIFDGDGGYDTATATINVEAVADAPELTLEVRAGNSVNEVIVDISSALVDTDGSESYILTFSDLPAGVVIQGASGGQISAPTGDDTITLILDEDTDFDFDFTVSATSTEASNNDTATTTETIDVVYDHNETSNNVTFEAIDQSIWTTGDEFVFTDDRFLGLDLDGSGSNGGLIPITWSYDLMAGFQSYLNFEGGDIDASIPWQLDFETNFNRTTNVLTLDTDASLLYGGSFQTAGPSLEYVLDFFLQYDFYADVDVNYGIDTANLFTIDWDNGDGYTLNIIDYDSTDEEGLSIDLPFGITATLAWPNLEVDGAETSLGTYEGDGASNNALDINLDIDQAIAEIFLEPYGIPNPFDLSVDIGIAGGSLELLDADVNAGLNFLQDFMLQSGDLDATLNFEDGSSTSFTFGDELTFDFASTLDVDNDGVVEFEVALELIGSTLNNDTDLGFNIGYNFDILKGDAWYDLWLVSDSVEFGPLVDLGDSFPIASIDVFETTVGVNFEEESVDLFA